jgi:hypothetical protein
MQKQSSNLYHTLTICTFFITKFIQFGKVNLKSYFFSSIRRLKRCIAKNHTVVVETVFDRLNFII